MTTVETRIRDRGATERRILAEATRLFAADGYGQVGMRAVAAAAGVNVALVHRYFGSKLGLFDAVLSAGGGEPPDLAAIPVADLPRRLAEYATSPGRAPGSPVLQALNRSGVVPEVRDLLRERWKRALLVPLSRRLTGPHAQERAALCAMVIMGIGTGRMVLGEDATPTPELTDRLTDVFRACIEGCPEQQRDG